MSLDSLFARHRAATLAFAFTALAGCSTTEHRAKPEPESGGPGRGDSPIAAVASGPVAAAVPAVVVASLERLAARHDADTAGRIELREIELAPHGPRALVAHGTGPMCAQQNCPYGVFSDEAGTYRPLLLKMGNEAPRIHPVGYLGRPDLSAMAIESKEALRSTRYRWDGAAYVDVSCRFIDRRTQQSRPCAPQQADEVAVAPWDAQRVCHEIARMASAARTDVPSATFLTQGFVLRDNEHARVEAVKVQGDLGRGELQPLVRCLRAARLDVLRLKARMTTDSLATLLWSLGAVPGLPGHRSLAISATIVPDRQFTLISAGVFATGLLAAKPIPEPVALVAVGQAPEATR